MLEDESFGRLPPRLSFETEKKRAKLVTRADEALRQLRQNDKQQLNINRA